VPRRSGNRHLADSYVPFDTFEAEDGWIAIVCATDEHWQNLTAAMGRPDLGADRDLATLPGRIGRIEELTATIGDWAATRSREEIGRLCQDAHVPAAPLREVTEVLTDPHLVARGFLTEVEGARGPESLPHSPMGYSGSPRAPLTRAPRLGEHTDEVLAELCGIGPDELAELHRSGVIH
jgi:CoA:oxalate CoA-transferase